MCGFAGILSTEGLTRDELRGHAERMAATLRHRGPDDEGAWVDEEAGVAFGFRRLSIIDLSEAGHQPMRSSTGRCTLMFNGEIYNYRELRADLEREGVRFRGASDTEVLLEALEAWGVERTLTRANGMFAVALWDSRDRTLTLARDRLGIKPLFVYWETGLLLFASELKALLAGPRFERVVDRDALTSYFRYLHVPAPLSIFRGVTKLLPGHMLVVRDTTRAPEPNPFWSLEEIADRGLREPLVQTEEQLVDAAQRVLQSAITRRLVADVPLGAFLSGGIDSSLVVALMKTAASGPVKTFAIAFEESEHDEAAHAARVARHLGTAHTEFTLTAKETRAVVPELVRVFDEPFASSSAIPNYLLCKRARGDVTVALSGTGGDEVFAGYNRYVYGAGLMQWTKRTPLPLRRLAGHLLSAVSSDAWERAYRWSEPALPGALRQRLPGDKVRKVAAALPSRTPVELYRSLVSAWQRPERIVLGGSSTSGRWDSIMNPDRFPGEWFDRLLLVDQLTYLPDDQLAKIDRVSMAVSLEVRVPILDHEVVEFAWRLPRRMKSRRRVGKWILREVLFRHVPRELIERPKVGLSVPLEDWLRGPLRSWADALLDPESLASDGLLDPKPIRSAWRSLQEGRGPNPLALWAIIMFQQWRYDWLS